MSILYGECSDLDYSECSNWPEYCEWNDEIDECQILEVAETQI